MIWGDDTSKRLAQQYRIVNEAAWQKIREWFFGPEDDGRDPLGLIFSYEARDLIIAVVVWGGVLHHLRLFTIGDEWELSRDLALRLDDLQTLDASLLKEYCHD